MYKLWNAVLCVFMQEIIHPTYHEYSSSFDRGTAHLLDFLCRQISSKS